ncbi:Zinc finger CCCH domain-containing protein 46 [Apostasia shenzhenica]|uniref:Zinc finger CCCH domain-containing protein 46 n=1 Tax=Apostasia shenzhenica TaxID=1088818 RepID=A0A2I0A7C6_9ASPA|nr:Zinc finger CCCH domain-containing protein 46 [Apostasia shenzhenica]
MQSLLFSCQYGDRCKFLHVTQQQPKSRPFGTVSQSFAQFQQTSQPPEPNPFGFGSQSSSQFQQTSQQPKRNPFGFGVTNSFQSNVVGNFGARHQNTSKAFENKWIRPTASTNSTPSQNSQAQSVVHKCTDPESCKRQIVEDFKNEAPLWKLTCYGHWKYLPCDIVGDVSYEELREAAYEDAKRGLALQSIVERERNLLTSKLAEFDNLLRNPYVIKHSGLTEVNHFPANNTTSTLITHSNKPPTVSSFSQLGTSTTVGNNTNFGTESPGIQSSIGFGHPSFPQNKSHILGGIEKKIGTSGSFGSQKPMLGFENLSGPINSGSNNGFMAMGSERSLFPSISPAFTNSSSNQSSVYLDGLKPNSSGVKQASAV